MSSANTSAFFNQVKKEFQKNRISNLRGYNSTLSLIKDDYKNGFISLKPNESGEWSVDLNTLQQLQKEGFDVVLGGAGAKRMSLSLEGVPSLTIRWDS